jgi:DHA1 family tetracycline resistance protein-like MFS transporter
MVISLILIYIAGHAVQSNWNYFTMYLFNWDVKMVGISLGIIGLLVGLVQGLLIRWINPKMATKEAFITVYFCMQLGCYFLLSLQNLG